MAVKRLFVVTDTHTGSIIPDLYFNDKQQAKRHRDELNKDSVPSNRYCVSPGPDHWKKEEGGKS
jgi:hypothetical protein